MPADILELVCRSEKQNKSMEVSGYGRQVLDSESQYQGA